MVNPILGALSAVLAVAVVSQGMGHRQPARRREQPERASESRIYAAGSRELAREEWPWPGRWTG